MDGGKERKRREEGEERKRRSSPSQSLSSIVLPSELSSGYADGNDYVCVCVCVCQALELAMKGRGVRERLLRSDARQGTTLASTAVPPVLVSFLPAWRHDTGAVSGL